MVKFASLANCMFFGRIPYTFLLKYYALPLCSEGFLHVFLKFCPMYISSHPQLIYQKTRFSTFKNYVTLLIPNAYLNLLCKLPSSKFVSASLITRILPRVKIIKRIIFTICQYLLM